MPESRSANSMTRAQTAELEERLRRASVNNRISCSVALILAKSLGIPAGEVGAAANRLKIKISRCQLGCF